MGNSDLIVVGGGLAGSEAAWQAAEKGLKVDFFEMRPVVTTGAHKSIYLAELVCSNSLGSDLPDRASGLLLSELRMLNSLLIDCAEKTRVPAGGALAVDRVQFSKLVTQKIENHKNIRIYREEITDIPDELAIISTGPLTSSKMIEAIKILTGQDNLFFYDAISPIISADSIDMNIAFRGSRYDRGTLESGDYINCPLSLADYETFIKALIDAERIDIAEFELELMNGVNAGFHKYFEGCLPIEILARRGEKALAFGPMRPVGLINPIDQKRPYAVVQLRQDNLSATLFNMVGFQTNLKFSEQNRVFRLIPGLENAEFLRFGQMHRNTFIFSPACISADLQFRNRSALFFAGQLIGIEGYAGNIGSGLLAGLNASRILKGKSLFILPCTTMLGALCHYVTKANAMDFQPMKANFGILPPLDIKTGNKRERAYLYSERSKCDLKNFLINND